MAEQDKSVNAALEQCKKQIKKAIDTCYAKDVDDAVKLQRIASFEHSVRKWCKKNALHKDVKLQQTLESSAGKTPKTQVPKTPKLKSTHRVKENKQTARTPDVNVSRPAKRVDVSPPKTMPPAKKRNIVETTAGSDVASRDEIVNNPEANCRCYEVLNVSRSASQEEVKRAFRKQALQKHPDKPGGNKSAYQSLDEAFQILFDPKRRSKYDGELDFRGKRDGSECTPPSGGADDGVPERDMGRPEMLCETFLSCPDSLWPELLKVASLETLEAITTMLKMNTVPPKVTEVEDTNVSSAGTATPGVKREGRHYIGKVSIGNVLVRTWKTNLQEAIDARICLEVLKAQVEAAVAAGTDHDEAWRKATMDVRSCHQAHVFYLHLSFEFAKSAEGKAVRLTTPKTSVIEVVLKDRNSLVELWDGHSAEEMKEANNNMIKREDSQRRFFDKSRRQRAGKLLTMVSKAMADKLPQKGVESIRIYRIIAAGHNGKAGRVGILPTPDVTTEPKFYFTSGETFRVSRIYTSPSSGRAYLKLTDGAGWVPEYSRKDPNKKIVAVADDVAATAIADGVADDAANKKDDAASSSSSSSSSDS